MITNKVRCIGLDGVIRCKNPKISGASVCPTHWIIRHYGEQEANRLQKDTLPLFRKVKWIPFRVEMTRYNYKKALRELELSH